ncbi:indole-3-acetic acid-amido synthetase GH3.6-like protein [Corchorus olitorius]|uniref:Indole-3-acetic acid-amido synthetase GH3.6-like protein n=1 Tax=Corchorus olitorius TaxID=93759 RepID=A0A1R3KZG5_9ROSI|nr:indole-3-acetic acid-amido synthetase GH3.6-like protein [Corchorus olitorius]
MAGADSTSNADEIKKRACSALTSNWVKRLESQFKSLGQTGRELLPSSLTVRTYLKRRKIIQGSKLTQPTVLKAIHEENSYAFLLNL